ncbi:MAG TPA: hypothetical protein VKV18_04465 [Chthonomonas sp.]|uniref:hypothetical protein n=1 Tax=Chthonomonas sp. TaxID=2282153 RepID=UPI002B4B63A6|nr:hypothetical protein [Chthonomonas sp.]HLI47929.1 hypothetical protein [Chthonomonas sp.]
MWERAPAVGVLADGAFVARKIALLASFSGRCIAVCFSSPHPPPLKADAGVPRKSQDFLGQGALPLPQFGSGADHLSGQYSSHNRLSLWPLHRRLQDRCIAVR